MNTDLFFNPVPVSTPPAEGPADPAPPPPPPSLEDEVSEVVGQLGKLWGGFRKQSASALELARKDLTTVVGQARTELSKLGAEAQQRISVELSRPPTVTSPQSPPAGSAPGALAEEAAPDASTTATASTSTDTTPGAEDAAESSTRARASTLTFFDRLQSTLPPTLALHLPPSTSASLAALRADLGTHLAHFQSTLSSDLSSVESVAAEYGRRGEALLKEAGVKGEALFKDAGEFLREAVKNVPEGGAAGEGMVWDGSDLWSLPGLSASMAGPSGSRSDAREHAAATAAAAGQAAGRASGDMRVPTTRAEVLLAQLRRTPGVLKIDPGAEPRSAPEWESWGAEQWGEAWRGKVDGEEAGDLKETKEALVPGEMDEETFWKRYFFRVFQIERDEERRKALLSDAATTQKEEDFSWDDEEDAAAPTSSAAAAPAAPVDPSVTPRASSSFEASPPSQTLSSVPSGSGSAGVIALSSGAPSPRQSSDDSFDVVGTDSAAGTDGGGAGGGRGRERGARQRAAGEKEDSEDSDWE